MVMICAVAILCGHDLPFSGWAVGVGESRDKRERRGGLGGGKDEPMVELLQPWIPALL